MPKSFYIRGQMLLDFVEKNLSCGYHGSYLLLLDLPYTIVVCFFANALELRIESSLVGAKSTCLDIVKSEHEYSTFMSADFMLVAYQQSGNCVKG